MKIESVRTITEIIDVETGEWLHVDDHFFRQNEAYLFLLRRRLYEYAYLKIGQPKYVCAVCRQPVVLLGKKTKRAQVVYFAHYKDSEDCPIKTHSGDMSKKDIERTIYIGETEYHQELKQLISCALHTSHIKDVEFSHVKEEERIASKLDFRSWAVPDIYAECGDLKINFEVQLSTLFLSTIIERDIYYRFHGIFIIWIFAPGAINTNTISRKDIIWTNNGNIFVYDQKARELTEQTGELTLLCQWHELLDDNVDTIGLTEGKYVTLSDLTFDHQTNTVYYVDVASDIEKRHFSFKKERAEMQQMELESLDEFRVLLDGNVPTKEEVLEGIKSGLYKPRWIKKGNYWGYAKYGHTIIPFIYNHAENFVDGLAFVRKNRKYGVVNEYGNIVCEPKYSEFCKFSEGLAAVKLNGKWGFINSNGIEVIPVQYTECQDFSEGLAAVSLNGKWGFINTEGVEVIVPQYAQVEEDFHDGYAIVTKGFWRQQILINTRGEVVVRNNTDLIVVPAMYDMCRDFSEGLAAVKLNGKWGFINSNGIEVIPVQYTECQDFSEGLAAVNLNGKWGFINTEGVEVIAPQYAKVEQDFHDGYAIVRKDFWGEQMRINSHGEIVVRNNNDYISVPDIYDEYRDFSEGLAAVKLNSKWGFINTEGVEVIAPQYAKVEQDFHNGYAIVRKDFGGEQMRINSQGEIVVRNNNDYISVPDIYDEYRDFSEGLAAVKLNGKWGFINILGEEIIQPRYTYADNFKGEYALVRNLRLWGIINKEGKNLVPTKYIKIKDIVNGVAEAVDLSGLDVKVCIETGQVFSTLDNYIKTKEKIKVYITQVKENGYECKRSASFNKGYVRAMFIPQKLTSVEFNVGDKTEVYIVKESGRSIIASTILCFNHFTTGEVCKGLIKKITSYGILVNLLNSNVTALAHISTFKHSFKGYNIGDIVDVEIITKDEQMQRVGIKFV